MDSGNSNKLHVRILAYSRPHYKKMGIILLSILLALLLLYFLFIPKKQVKEEAKNAPVSVVTGITSVQDVPVYISALGAVNSVITVTVKTQINGQLQEVYFKDGQMVKKGELLAKIDPRPFEAQLTQYQGQWLRDKALLANASLDLKRYEMLHKQDSVSKQTLDTQRWLVKQYEGNVKTDEGLIASTKLNIQYCYIRSPVTAQVGLRLIDPGNYVQTSDTTGLFILNTIDPMLVEFSIPEDNIQEVVKQFRKKALLTQAYDRTQNTLLSTGKLSSIDNQIDPTTGTIKLKARFDNKKRNLFTNQFINVKLKIKDLPNSIVVPTAAIQHGAQGNFVFILNENQTVSVRPVTTSVVYNDHTVIQKGLAAGDIIIIDGTDKLSEGAIVKVNNPEATKRDHT